MVVPKARTVAKANGGYANNGSRATNYGYANGGLRRNFRETNFVKPSFVSEA